MPRKNFTKPMTRRTFIKAMGTTTVSFMLGGCSINSPVTKKVSQNASSSSESVQKFTGTIEYRVMPRTGEKIELKNYDFFRMRY